MSNRKAVFAHLPFEFGLSAFSSLVALIPFEEKSTNGDDEEGVHDDEDAQVLEIGADEVTMNDGEE